MVGDTKGMEAVALSDASAAMHIEGLLTFLSFDPIAAVYGAALDCSTTAVSSSWYRFVRPRPQCGVQPE